MWLKRDRGYFFALSDAHLFDQVFIELVGEIAGLVVLFYQRLVAILDVAVNELFVAFVTGLFEVLLVDVPSMDLLYNLVYNLFSLLGFILSHLNSGC